MTRQTEQFYEFGPFRIAVSERVLLRDGQAVPLAPKVFDTLLVLVQNSGRILEKDELMKAVWPDVVVEEVNLAHNISVLRKVFANEASGQQYIETVPRRGYRFMGEVREVSDNSAEMVIAERTRSSLLIEEEVSDQKDAADTGAGDQLRLQAKRKRVLKVISLGVAIAVLSVLAFYLWQWSRPRRLPNTTLKSIAVLPFKPLIAGSRDEPLELGIADTLITRLSSIKDLVVRPIGTVRKYAALDQDPVAAGRELNVDLVLDGSIQRSGEHIRIAARLVRVSDGASVWSEQFDHDFTSLFELQDTISNRVTSALALKLTGEERALLAKRYTEDNQAYQSYIKGRYYWNQRTEAGLKKSIEYFNEAIEKDHAYALALSGLADSYTTLGYFSYLAPEEAFPKAKEAAVRALELDPALAEPHTSLAYASFYYDWNWAEAESQFQQAIALNQNYATAHHWYGVYLTAMRRFDEALAEIMRARELDPTSLIINTDLGFSLYYSRRYDDAIRQLQTVLDMNKDFPLAHLWLGRAYQEKDMYREAIAEFERAEAVMRDWPVALGAIGYVEAASGNSAEARKMLARLDALSNERYITPYAVALIHAALAERDEAFAWLNKAHKDRSHWLVWLKIDPRFNSLHSDSRFADIAQSVGLAP